MPVHTAQAVPTGSDLRARPRNPILATMAATVPIVGNRRENPSVYLRPIAQAGSHMPAMSRKSQAMGDPPYNVCSTQCLSTLSAVRAACPRKKDSAAKNYEFEKKKTAFCERQAWRRLCWLAECGPFDAIVVTAALGQVP